MLRGKLVETNFPMLGSVSHYSNVLSSRFVWILQVALVPDPRLAFLQRNMFDGSVSCMILEVCRFVVIGI